jgi:hypothetical protein
MNEIRKGKDEGNLLIVTQVEEDSGNGLGAADRGVGVGVRTAL